MIRHDGETEDAFSHISLMYTFKLARTYEKEQNAAYHLVGLKTAAFILGASVSDALAAYWVFKTTRIGRRK